MNRIVKYYWTCKYAVYKAYLFSDCSTDFWLDESGDIGGSFRGNTFSSPEAALLVISTKNCDFWAVQHRKSAIPSNPTNLAENTKSILCAYSENWDGLASYADVLRLVTRAEEARVGP